MGKIEQNGSERLKPIEMNKRYPNYLFNLILFAVSWFFLEGISYLIYENLPPHFANGKRQVQQVLGRTPDDSQRSILPHPYLLYANNPCHWDSVQQHNAWGYRNESVAFEKPANTLRILVLGGSTTYGYLNRDPSLTWPSLLENKLKLHYGQNVEVINGGLNYATSAELLAAYSFRHRYLRPDWVILHLGGNDAAATLFPYYDPEYTHFRAAGKQTSIRPGERQLLRSNVIKVFYSLWLNSLETVYESQPGDFAQLNAQGVAERVKRSDHYAGFARNVDLLLQLAKQDGSQVMTMGFLHASRDQIQLMRPDLAHIVDEFMFAVVENKRILQALSHMYGIPYIDPDQAYFADRLFYDYCHLKPEGEALKAQLVFDHFRDFGPFVNE